MSKEQIYASVSLESYEWFLLHHTHSNEGEFSPSFNYTNKVPTFSEATKWGSWAEHEGRKFFVQITHQNSNMQWKTPTVSKLYS